MRLSVSNTDYRFGERYRSSEFVLICTSCFLLFKFKWLILLIISFRTDQNENLYQQGLVLIPNHSNAILTTNLVACDIPSIQHIHQQVYVVYILAVTFLFPEASPRCQRKPYDQDLS